MRSKPTSNNHGIGIGLGSGGDGGRLLLFWAILFIVSSDGDGLCIPREREALLNFKRGLTDPSDKLSSWRWVEDENPHGHGHGDGVDCCHWRGVVCHNSTGHVLQLRLGCEGSTCWKTKKVNLGGKLGPSLLDLKQLTHLDLSFNDFQGIPIPRFLGSLHSLTYLNLSHGGFGGMIPQQLGNLSNLHSLHLGSPFDYPSSNLRSDGLGWVTGLSKLQYLDLSGVVLREARDWLQATNTLPSLKQLRLSSCQISSALTTPPTTLPVLNFSHLSVLDLSWNRNSFSWVQVPEWVFSLPCLTSLDLSCNSLPGPIPVGLANLTRLTTLELSFNSFNSSIPEWLFHRNKLQVLDLGGNLLEGVVIPEGIGNMTALSYLDLSYNSKLKGVGHVLIKSLGNLCSLRELGLSWMKLGREGFEAVMSLLSGCADLAYLELIETQLTGKFGNLVDKLAQFNNLVSLYLQSNSLHGPIPKSVGRLSSLEYFSVEHNQLNGTLPESLGQLTRLQQLFISDNQLTGDVTDAHFSNLTELAYFSAARNKLRLKLGTKWVPPFQLESLDLDSCRVGPPFPLWLQSQKHLTSLRLSGAGISSAIPDWFQESSPHCYFYNLSHNQIYGDISKFVLSAFEDDTLIDLGSNRLSGPLPPISPLIATLVLSNNHFSGSISHFPVPQTK